MLDKKFRLRSRKDFERIFKEGIYFPEDWLVLKIARNNMAITRFGFVVSNKISKVAAKRNKIKRMLRESIRTSSVVVVGGFDCLFIVRRDVSEKKTTEVRVVVEKLLNKCGLLKK